MFTTISWKVAKIPRPKNSKSIFPPDISVKQATCVSFPFKTIRRFDCCRVMILFSNSKSIQSYQKSIRTLTTVILRPPTEPISFRQNTYNGRFSENPSQTLRQKWQVARLFLRQWIFVPLWSASKLVEFRLKSEYKYVPTFQRCS